MGWQQMLLGFRADRTKLWDACGNVAPSDFYGAAAATRICFQIT